MKNLPRVVALMLMAGHLRLDHDSFQEDDSFLRASSSFQAAANDEGKLQGNYLFHDNIRARFIRQGSCTASSCRGFQDRYKEHKKAALREGKNSDSEFYSQYPQRGSLYFENCRRVGQFDELSMMVGIA